jgi:7,8-dihydropterin-6-yl-methyl-4-(beta-D-ribofuranosyl)aminobenzene 5'-phosphate synthase
MELKLIVSGSRRWERWIKRWGLSFLIDGDILFDTFADFPTLSRGAKRANVDLDRIRSIIISHEHWDHIGGLWQILELRKGLPVYLPPHCSAEFKAKVGDAGGQVDHEDITALKDNVYLFDELMGTYNAEPIPEQAVVLKSGKGLVLVVGCSHPGIVTMVKRVSQAFGEPVYGVVGGLHLVKTPEAEIVACANGLKNLGVSFIAPTHCTGALAEKILGKVFGNGYVSLREGQSLLF